MTQCNNEKTANMIYDLFEEKLDEFTYVGEKSWSNPAGSWFWPTYEINNKKGVFTCALVDWVVNNTDDINRKGIIITDKSSKSSRFSGHIVELVIPFEFKRTYNTRAFEENGKIEIRSYGSFNAGKAGKIKKTVFFDFVSETGLADVYYDEELEHYIKVFEIKDGKISKEEFADSLIDFTLLVKVFKDRYR